MKKLLQTIFSEKRLILDSIETPVGTVSEKKDIPQRDIGLMDLSEKSGEKISLDAETQNKIAEITSNEFEFLGSKEISFNVPTENGETQRRSFVFREKSIFAKELMSAIGDADAERIKYLCYKYLRDLYANKKSTKGLDTKKYGKSNLIIDSYVRNYEKQQRQTQRPEITETQSDEALVENEWRKEKVDELTKTQNYGKAKVLEDGTSSQSNLEESIRIQDLEALDLAVQDKNPEFSFYEPLSRYNQEEIIQNYDNLRGTTRITNLLASKDKTIDKNKAAEIVAEIIYARAADNFFTDEDIFDTLNEYKVLNYKEDYETFAKNIKNRPASETESQSKDFLFIRTLSDSLKNLKYEKKSVESAKNKEGLENESYVEAEKIMIANLENLLNFSETENGNWEKLIALLNGVGSSEGITMRDINGKESYIDEGIFKRHTNTESALNILITDDNVLEMDKNNKPMIRWEKLLPRINDLILKGYQQKILIDYPNADDQEKFLNSAEYKQKIAQLRVYTITDLQDFSNEQKQFFQLGFILDRTKVTQKEEKEASEVVETQMPEYWKSFEESLKKQAIPAKIIENIEKQLLLAVGTRAIFKDGKFEKIQGFGAGTSISLGEGFSLSLGLATKDGESLQGGIGLSLNLYKDDSVLVNYSIGLGSTGNIGTMLQAETGNKDIAVGGGIGVGINFKTGKLQLGGNAEITFKIEGNMQRNIDKAKEKSPYFEAFEKFKESTNVEEKYYILMGIPGIEKTARNLQTRFNLSNEDIVNMIEMSEEQITQAAIENTSVLDSTLPLIHKVGVAMVGIIPVPYISIYIGTSEVFIPNRKSISHLRDVQKLRQHSQDSIMEDALKTAENDPAKLVFNESIKEVTYTVDGEFAVIEESKTVDFTTVGERIESYNTALKDINMSMEKHESNKMEISINNTRGKDLEVFIDPTLTDLALIRDGNKLCLEGNLEELVITRDKYNLPFKYNENSSNVRDVVVIRKKSSLQGQRSRDWITTQTTGQYLSKKVDQGYKTMDIGQDRGGAWNQKNLLEINGYIEKPDYTGQTDENGLTGLSSQESIATDFAKQRSKKFKELSLEEQQRIDEVDAKADEVLGLMSKEEFEEKYKTREGLYTDIHERMKDKKFMTEVGKIMNKNSDLLRDFVTKPEFIDPPLNDNEITEAMSIIMDEYYSQILLNKYEGMDNFKVNKDIAKRLRKRIEQTFVPVLEEDLKTTMIAMGNPDAERLSKEYTQRIIEDTVEALIFKLEMDPDFDFRNQEVTRIIAGSAFYSVTRDEKGNPVSSYTANKKGAENVRYVLEKGILKASENIYSSNDEIGKVLLEMMSPIENLSNSEYMKSPMVKKLLAFKEPMRDILGIDNYERILDMNKDPKLMDNLENSSTEDLALKKFQKLIDDLRKAEINGKPLIIKIPEKDRSYTIRINSEITAGSFSKCVNSSFLLLQEIEISGYDKEGNLTAEKLEHNETITSSQGKVAATITGGVAFENRDTPPPEKGKDASEGKRIKEADGKDSNKGKANPIPTSDGDAIVPDYVPKGVTGHPV